MLLSQRQHSAILGYHSTAAALNRSRHYPKSSLVFVHVKCEIQKWGTHRINRLARSLALALQMAGNKSLREIKMRKKCQIAPTVSGSAIELARSVCVCVCVWVMPKRPPARSILR